LVWPRRYGDPTTDRLTPTQGVDRMRAEVGTALVGITISYDEISLSEHLFERYQGPLTRIRRVAPPY
jgi:hypothetical protein